MAIKSFVLQTFLAIALLPQVAFALSEQRPIASVPLAFSDEQHNQIELAAYRGSPVVLAMMYTSCKNSCPMLLVKLLTLERQLKDSGVSAQFVVVSMDSEHDTPDVLKEFKHSHGIDRANWHLLHGDENTTRTLSVLLGVSYQRSEDGEILHSTMIALLDKTGTLQSSMEGLAAPLDGMVAVAKSLRETEM